MSLRNMDMAINRLTKVEEKEHNKRVTEANRVSSRSRAMISINE
jgi:hypothetical protein